jgi:23S rRNA (guanosine2251-2'-O)-methyltransferase
MCPLQLHHLDGELAHEAVVRCRSDSATWNSRSFLIWIYGLDERGEQDCDQVDYGTPTAFVLGGEAKGLYEPVRKHCDVLVRIPMAGKISSLNVSVTTGLVLFEWNRRLPLRARAL